MTAGGSASAKRPEASGRRYRRQMRGMRYRNFFLGGESSVRARRHRRLFSWLLQCHDCRFSMISRLRRYEMPSIRLDAGIFPPNASGKHGADI